MASSGFDDLLHQARQLTADMEMGAELPRVERNLFQIRDAALKMAYKTPSIAGDVTDVKASLLLSSRGFDISKVSQKLESLNRAKTFEPLEPIRDVDIQAFLRNEHENAMLAAAEHTRNSTFEEASQMHLESLECEWEKDKQKLLNSLIEMSDTTFEFYDQGASLSDSTMYSGSQSRMNSAVFIDSPVGYEDIIMQYNESVINGGYRKNLAASFVELSKKQDDQVLLDIWQMIQILTDVSVPSNTNSFRTSASYQTSLVSKSIQYLEKRFLKHIEKMVACNLQQAHRGGVPGTYNLIRSFFNIRSPLSPNYAEDGLVDGHAVWAIIYYCLRCGDAEAISQAIEKSKKIIGDFAKILLEYNSNKERKLSSNTEREVKLHYRRNISMSSDPYKKLVYCIIGKCEPQDDHGDVATTTDDYLWVKLSQLTSTTSSDGQEQLTLAKFQHQLIENFGEAHFGASQQPLLYFKVLMLTGQFEAAVEFLSRFDSYKSVAVHVAVVLHETRLLLLPQNPQVQLLTKDGVDTPMKRLNFARLISTFTKRFELSDPQKAINYFYFLRNLTTESDENLFTYNVCEIVMATKEFDLLLGQLQVDGTRKPGVIDKFKVDPMKIIERVAHESEVKGQLNDSVILYDLGSNYAKVVELLNKLLSQILSQSAPSKLNKDNIKKLAISVADRYSKQNVHAKVDQSSMTTFHLLLDISSFFDCYHANKYEDAYSIIRDLDILAFSEDTIEERVKNFCTYSDEVRRCLPDILLALVSILVHFCKELKPGTGFSSKHSLFGSQVLNDSSRTDLLKQYKKQAHALVSFSGSMPYRMPADTTARLVHMEASIK